MRRIDPAPCALEGARPFSAHMSAPRILSGIKPTGKPHLGNYFGMMKPAIEWQDKAVAAPVEPTTVPMEDVPSDGRKPAATEPDFMNMTDADIERQIDEIKKALKKHQGGK